MFRIIVKFFLSVIIFFLTFTVSSQSSNKLWTERFNFEKSTLPKEDERIEPKEFKLFELNLDLLKSKLNESSKRFAKGSKSGVVITFPNELGEIEKFEVFEASIMAEGLQKKYPKIKSFIGKGIDNPFLLVRFSVTPIGLNVIMLNGLRGTVYIDPYEKEGNSYEVYLKSSIPKDESFECELKIEKTIKDKVNNLYTKTSYANDGNLRTFRLAVATTGEYSQYHLNKQGVSSEATEQLKKETVLSALNITLTRVSAIFERDISVTMNLVDNNEEILFLNPLTDQLTNNNKYQAINESQVIIDDVIGSSNYDFGHVFVASDIGGIAYLGAVCVEDIKGSAVSGSETPEGDYFEGIVAHEIGHQFGASHTYNNCGGNLLSLESTVEPGSGSTIMSYAGLCPGQDVQLSRDFYFHFVNINQMWEYISNGQGQCGDLKVLNNTAPVISDISNYTIPILTPFILDAEVIDVDGDDLSYTWEQVDVELVGAPPKSNFTNGPAFRSRPPSSSSRRSFPDEKTISSGNISNQWEVLPSVARKMNFGLTVRDNNLIGGQTANDEIEITFNDEYGAFEVTSQSGIADWSVGTSQTVTWEVAGSNNAPISCLKVNILFSLDGGMTFPITLASDVNNDGFQDIQVPNIITSGGKIKVESIGNIFYSISKGYVSIQAPENKIFIPDEVFEQELIDKGYDDLIDNFVLKENIENVQTLIIENKEIYNLKGIEGFVNLESVVCKNTKLTSLDLTKNMMLQFIDVSSNDLILLTLPDNSNIEMINAENNRLDSLIVSNCTKMSELNLSNNYISTIDLINNTVLTKLSLMNNNLVAIDVSKNLLLKYIDVSSTMLGKNKISTLNVLNNAELVSLKAQSNELESIDISKNNLLETLVLSDNNFITLNIKDNPNLMELLLSYNQIQSLDVSNNTILSSLFVYENPLSCIQVNQVQLDTVVKDWHKDTKTNYSIDCTSIVENDFDNDGVFDLDDYCPNTPIGETVDENGCSSSELDVDNDGVLIYSDLCPDSLFGEEVNNSGCSIVETELWGTTRDGGIYKNGSIFKYNLKRKEYTTVFNFEEHTTGQTPIDGLMRASNGKLYGLANSGGSKNSGLLYEYDVENNSFNIKFEFSYENNFYTGSFPTGGLLEASNGKLYGFTQEGGKYSYGVLFEFDLSINTYTKLHDFESLSGKHPKYSLIQSSNGKLYGTTFNGGLNDEGVLFEYDIENKLFVKKIDFKIEDTGSRNFGDLFEASNGKIYSGLNEGGKNNSGVLLEYNSILNQYRKVHEFGAYANGANPLGYLMESNTGRIYGFTSRGGDYDAGVLYKYSPFTEEYLKMIDISNSNNWIGIETLLVQSINGKCYGTNSGAQGLRENGILFEYDITTNTMSEIIKFEPNDGRWLSNKLVEIRVDSYSIDDDLDGIPNSMDQCTDTPTGETVNKDGCSESQLDDDSDGIMNDIDQCLNTPTGEIVNSDGCSESQLDDDSDGIMNDVDQCLNTPTGEIVNSDGCSESQLDDDSDGIMNDIDQCPNTPIGETINSDGCSESQLDDDNDGVPNSIDQCPDTTAMSTVDPYGCFTLPFDNFKIEVVGESCIDKDNGQINITANASYNYITTIKGVNYDFTNSLIVNNLEAGEYSVCISVIEEPLYEQCYNLVVEGASEITGKSSSTKVGNKTTEIIEITTGTAPYTLSVNGIEMQKTNSNILSAEVSHGDLLSVTSKFECEGKFEKNIDLSNEFIVYPNPTSGLAEIDMLNIDEKEVVISTFNLQQQLISRKTYQIEYGKVGISLKDLSSGIYFVKIELDTVVHLKVIKK